MAKKDSITRDDVLSLLNYCPESGVFRWKPRDISQISNLASMKCWNARYAGQIAGTKKDGYLIISLRKCLVRAHRLAWLIVYGSWPSFDIDHINGNRSDNRIKNLRQATRSENLWNMKNTRRNSTSKFKGVFWNSQVNKWQAVVNRFGKRHTFGFFNCEQEAAEASRLGRELLHGEFHRHE